MQESGAVTMEKIQHFTSFSQEKNHVGKLSKRSLVSEKSLICRPLVLLCRRRRRRGRKTRTAIKRRKIQVNEETEMMISDKEIEFVFDIECERSNMIPSSHFIIDICSIKMSKKVWDLC